MSASSQAKERQALSQKFLRGEKTLLVSAPGSCANLGPGFDTLAVAVDLQCQIALRLLPEKIDGGKQITLSGSGTAGLTQDGSNFVMQLLTSMWPHDRELLDRLQVSISSEIPLARGVGSSAAAAVAALSALALIAGKDIDHLQILRQAAKIEGHADNASASLFGGLTLVCQSAGHELIVRQLPWPHQWHLVLLVPSHKLSTKQARAVMPKQVALPDAVYNLQHVGLLTSAVFTGDDQSLVAALSDRLHEPYREALVPELAEVRRLLAGTPALGAVLSGAGSSVLAFVHEKDKQALLDSLHCWTLERKPAVQVLPVSIARQGVSYDCQ